MCSSYEIKIGHSTPGITNIYVSPSEKTGSPIGFSDSTSNELDFTNQESHSSGSYYVGVQGPAITIEKYTKDFKETYYKNNNITIKLKIINSYKQNRLENAYLYEEIPDGFEFICANPSNIIDPNKPNSIIWYCGDKIRSSKTYEYTIRTNKSGRHNFGSTMLEATVVDKNGRKNDVIVNSNRPISVLICNNPPKFLDLNPEPPINVRRELNGYLIGHKHKYITVSLTDPDNDTINCELLSSSGCKPITPINSSTDTNIMNGVTYYNYTWDISCLNIGTHFLTLDAFDGDDHNKAVNIELNTFIIPPKIASAFYTFMIIVIAGVIVRHSFIYSSLSLLKDKLTRKERLDKNKKETNPDCGSSCPSPPDNDESEKQRKNKNYDDDPNYTSNPEQSGESIES